MSCDTPCKHYSRVYIPPNSPVTPRSGSASKQTPHCCGRRSQRPATYHSPIATSFCSHAPRRRRVLRTAYEACQAEWPLIMRGAEFWSSTPSTLFLESKSGRHKPSRRVFLVPSVSGERRSTQIQQFQKWKIAQVLSERPHDNIHRCWHPDDRLAEEFMVGSKIQCDMHSPVDYPVKNREMARGMHGQCADWGRTTETKAPSSASHLLCWRSCWVFGTCLCAAGTSCNFFARAVDHWGSWD
ncbi:hypothetical protein EDB83DRAFT_309884 [Lactarius deliciosus]|nr:hypothetical protein EDB83DRAFT_309884 [Lactarius deliciosus]